MGGGRREEVGLEEKRKEGGGEWVHLLPFFLLRFSAQSKASLSHGDAARWG